MEIQIRKKHFFFPDGHLRGFSRSCECPLTMAIREVTGCNKWNAGLMDIYADDDGQSEGVVSPIFTEDDYYLCLEKIIPGMDDERVLFTTKLTWYENLVKSKTLLH